MITIKSRKSSIRNKEKLNFEKDEREKFRKQSQKLKQQTGIENDDSLKNDYNNRKIEIEEIMKEITLLKEHHLKLITNLKGFQTGM